MTTTYLQQDTFVGIQAIYEDRRYVVDLLGQYFSSLSSAWDASIDLVMLRDHGQTAAMDDLDSISQALVQDFVSDMYPFILEKGRKGRHLALSEDMITREVNWRIEFLSRQMRAELGRDDESHVDSLQLAILESLNRKFRRYLRPLKLDVRQLRIESPMEITLAVVQGGGVLGVSAYALHLLREVLRDPEHVGSWVGRLVESWHKGMMGAATARYERKQMEQERKRKQGPVTDAERQLIEAAEGLGSIRVLEVKTVGAGAPPVDLRMALDDPQAEGPTEADS